MRRLVCMLVVMLTGTAWAAAQGLENDPVLKLDVVRVEAREVSPVLVTRLHERFPDQRDGTWSVLGSGLLDTLSVESFLPFDPFEPIELPKVKELLKPDAGDGPILKPNN